MTRKPQLRNLHVVSGDLWAGAEAQVAALLTYLARSGDVDVCAALMNPGELEQRLRAAGIEVTILDERRMRSWQILAGLRRLIRTYRPDVVHTHRAKENVLGSAAARLEGRVPSLRTAHGADEHPPPAWRLDKRAVRGLDRMAARRWQRACVAVSTDLAQLLQRQLPGARIEVIHNGLDEQAYVAARQTHLARPPTAGRRVAFLGRLVPVKRVDLLLDVAAALNRREPGRWHVEIVGDGPLRDSLASRAAAQGLQGTVTFHGFRPDAIDVLAGCDVLALTSDHEGTPMAALEALAVGVPVVARRVGGMPELLEGISPSMLVDSDRPEDLADALAAVCRHPRERAAELPDRYRIATCAAAYVRLYREMAGGRA